MKEWNPCFKMVLVHSRMIEVIMIEEKDLVVDSELRKKHVLTSVFGCYWEKQNLASLNSNVVMNSSIILFFITFLQFLQLVCMDLYINALWKSWGEVVSLLMNELSVSVYSSDHTWKCLFTMRIMGIVKTRNKLYRFHNFYFSCMQNHVSSL